MGGGDMDLITSNKPAKVTMKGGQKVTLNAGQRLKIKATAGDGDGGETILNEKVPSGKVYTAHISVHIDVGNE